MADAHLDADTAMLYASGSLDPREVEAIDIHAANCNGCARALADASATIETIELQRGTAAAPMTLRRGSSRAGRWPIMPAIAAAAVLLAIFSLARVTMLNTALHDRDIALSSLVHSHFNHTPFVAVQPGAPAGKVLYAQDGRWLYVIVDAPPKRLQIEAITQGGSAVPAGNIEAAHTPQTAYVQTSQRVVRIELRDASGAPVARAALVYRR